MSASISFSNISPNLRIPLVSFEFDNSQAGANQTEQVTLLIGGTLNAMPAVPLLGISGATSRALFGNGSMLSRMHEDVLNGDQLGTIWLLPVADPAAGVACTEVQTITGTATQAGTLSTYVGGQLVASLVNVGDTATVMAAAVVAAAALMPELPMTVAASGGVLTWTSKHKGLSGNSVDLRMNFYGLPNGEILPAGVTVAISDANNGTADPDLSGLDAILGDVAYDFVGCGFTGSAAVASIKALMATRWSSVRQVFGHAWMSVVQSEASLVTFGGTNNDPHTDIFGYYDSPTPPWEATAQILAAAAPALKADPARPVQTLQLQGFMAPPPASRFNASQKQTLLTNGIALLSHDNAGNTAILRAITTYQDNAFGQPDQSYLDCETLYTLMAITRQLSAMVTQKFPRSKVADDGTPFGAGQPIVTPKILKAELVAEYATMETNGLVEDADAMAAATIVVRNLLNPGRLDVLFCPYLIQGLRVVAIKNQFRLFSALAAAAAA